MVIDYQKIERSNKIKGFLISFVIHAAILLLFLLFYLTPPNPPLAELELGGGGVELNYGDPEAGTGDPTNLEPSTPEVQEEQVAALAEPEASEEIITGDEESVVIPTEEKKTDNQQVKVKDDVKPAETKPTTQTQTADSRFTMSKSNTAKSGEDKGKAGDPGKPNGTVDGRALMGTPGKGGGTGGGIGTGNGPSIGGGLSGWRFLRQPKVNDNTSEKGKLTFKITVNEDGIIEKALVTENLGGISPKLQEEYKKALIGSELENVNGVVLNSATTGTVVWEISAK